jgi:phage recombination protein Bet
MGRRFVDIRTIQRRMQFKDDRINRALRKGADMDRLALANTPTLPAVPAEQLALIKRTIAKDATDDELALFIHDCARQGVHPLDKLIHFTKRKGKYTPITSIDFFRIRAGDSGECLGSDDAIFTGTPLTASFEARVTVYRLVQGQRGAFSATARWAEYKPDEDFIWKKMPHVMLAKCAEALALRKAFPKQLHGLYVTEEMEQADNAPKPIKDLGRECSPPPLNKSLTPSPGPAVTDAVIADPGLGVSATPANLNQDVPDAWKPFTLPKVDAGRARGRVVSVEHGVPTKNKAGKVYIKTTVTLDTGEVLTTLDRDLAAKCSLYQVNQWVGDFTVKDTRWGKDILTLQQVPEAGDDAAF